MDESAGIRLPDTPKEGGSRSTRSSKEVVPVPWLALLPIILYRIADAITYSVLFPTITEMVTSFGTPPDKIGFYAGLGEGILMALEAVVATSWAKLADRFGRRPCLVWGAIAILPTIPLTGFSRSVWTLTLWRALYGLSPAAIVAKIYTGEITHPSNRTKIYSVFSPSFMIGMIMGDVIGGELANPYGRLPWWLGGTTTLWRDWPYALPQCVAAGFSLVAILVSLFTLIETRPPSLARLDEPLSPGSPDLAEAGIELKGPAPERSYREVLRVPHYATVLSVFALFQLAAFMSEGILTVYTYTPVDQGGLGLPVTSIGLMLAISGAMYALSVPFALPFMTKRLGTKRSTALIVLAWPIMGLSIPLAQWAATTGSRFFLWTILVCQLACKNFGNFAWPVIDMMLTGCFDPHPHLLAMGQALSLIAGAGGRAVGPTISGGIFSQSTRFPAGSLGRQISWLSFLAVTIPLVICQRFLPSPKEDFEEVNRDEYEQVPLQPDGMQYEEDLPVLANERSHEHST